MWPLQRGYVRLYYCRLHRQLYPTARVRFQERAKLALILFEYVHFTIYAIFPARLTTLARYDPMLNLMVNVLHFHYYVTLNTWAFLTLVLLLFYTLSNVDLNAVVWKTLGELVLDLTDAYERQPPGNSLEAVSSTEMHVESIAEWLDRLLRRIDHYTPNICGYRRLLLMCAKYRKPPWGKKEGEYLATLTNLDRFWLMLMLNVVDLLSYTSAVVFVVLSTFGTLGIFLWMQWFFPLYYIPICFAYSFAFHVHIAIVAEYILFLVLNLVVFDFYLIRQFKKINRLFAYLVRKEKSLGYVSSHSLSLFLVKIMKDHNLYVTHLLQADREIFSLFLLAGMLTNVPSSMLFTNLMFFRLLRPEFWFPIGTLITVQWTFLSMLLMLMGYLSTNVHLSSRYFIPYQFGVHRAFLRSKLKLLSMYEKVKGHRRISHSIGALLPAVTLKDVFESIMLYFIYLFLFRKLITN